MPTKNVETVNRKSVLKNTSGEPVSDNPSTESTTAAVAKRLENVHPRARTKVRDTAEYVSPSLQEYTIQYEPPRFYVVVQYKGGKSPPELSGAYLSKAEAHDALVRYLRSIDKFGKAIWPGK